MFEGKLWIPDTYMLPGICYLILATRYCVNLLHTSWLPNIPEGNPLCVSAVVAKNIPAGNPSGLRARQEECTDGSW